MADTERRIRFERIVFGGLLIILALANILLIRQNLQMRGELKAHQPDVLKAGSKAWAFSAPGLRGGMIDVRYDGSGPKRAFFYFSPECSYCHDQFPYWQQVLNGVDSSRFQIIGLASDSEDKTRVLSYLQSAGVESMDVALVPGSVLRSYKLAVTPTTVIVANDGTVEAVWTGAWSGDICSLAGATFGIALRPK